MDSIQTIIGSWILFMTYSGSEELILYLFGIRFETCISFNRDIQLRPTGLQNIVVKICIEHTYRPHVIPK